MFETPKPKIDHPEVAYLIGTSQGSIVGFEKHVNRDIRKWIELVDFDGVTEAVQIYRLKAKSNWLDLNLLSQCVLEVMRGEHLTKGEAWAMVMKATRDTTNRPTLPDVVMQTVEALGGWRSIVRSDSFISERSNFYKLYDDNLKTKLQEAYLCGK